MNIILNIIVIWALKKVNFGKTGGIAMGKKIVVITGSPRKNGNSLAMTNAFIEAAEAKGHSVTRFDAVSLNVGGCHACETCFRSGKACSFDDDFNSIAPAILEADTIVYTMPVYWYSIPAKIKAVIDKTFPFGMEGENIAGKGCGLICCCAEEDMSVMDGVRIPIERTAALLKWHMVGEVLIPGVQNAGDIEKTDGCRQAATLAEKI
jgi:multimeric flavodoxin wrbA family protein